MLNVKWDEDTCFQSGDCASLLPNVFKVENDRVVINTEGASEDAIRDAVARCPSGALRVEES